MLVRSRLFAEDGVMNAPADAFKRGEPDPPEEKASAAGASPRPLSTQDQELRRRLTDALTAARGNVTEVARALGKGRVQIHRLMRRLNVDPKTFRS